MTTLEDALYDLNLNRVLEILEFNHDLSKIELDEALAIAISSEGPDGAIMPLLSHGALLTHWSFCGAAARRDVVAFKAFLDHGWDINSLDFGQPALRLAIGSEEVVQWFLDHGADPNLRGTVLELLISYGAQLDPQALFHAIDPRGKGGIPAMKYLIDRGVDVNTVGTMAGTQGGTPLHYAAKLKSKEKLTLLLEAGADKNIKSSSGRTPVDVAKDKGFMEGFELLPR
ncbi:hypothetical protein EG329_000689 [Mollisiaceae sp. DMI_Dod_QoI]|nr:hypothetical protein EG329_000689 [Helotiales sp. DMI_Dod_QoI]